jgi:putative transposase
LQQAAKDCDTSYQRFFEGISGYPNWRRKYINESFRFPQGVQDLKRLGSRKGSVYLPKFGDTAFRWTQEILGKLLTTTVKLETDGWYVCFTCEIDLTILDNRQLYNLGFIASKSPKTPVGLDRGCNIGVFASTGETYCLPTEKIITLEKEIAYQQSKLGKKVKNSSNYKKARKRIAKIHRRIVNIADNGHHQTSWRLANNHSLVFLEDLKISNMTASAKGTLENPGSNVKAKSGLNKAILRQRWGKLARFLAYKAGWFGGVIIKVPPYHTSTTCFDCKYKDALNRQGQEFKCRQCNWTCHADYNASLNILFDGMVRFLSSLLILGSSSLTAGLAGIACGDASSQSRSKKQEPLCSEFRSSGIQLGIPRL